MKKISKRAWMAMALAMALLAGLLIFVGSYFVNAKTWVTFPGSPHVYTGVNPDCGRIYDRSGMLLLNTDDGRVYNADETIRRSTMHLLGDRDGLELRLLENLDDALAAVELLLRCAV